MYDENQLYIFLGGFLRAILLVCVRKRRDNRSSYWFLRRAARRLVRPYWLRKDDAPGSWHRRRPLYYFLCAVYNARRFLSFSRKETSAIFFFFLSKIFTIRNHDFYSFSLFVSLSVCVSLSPKTVVYAARCCSIHKTATVIIAVH